MYKTSIMAKSVMVAMGIVGGLAHADNNRWTGFYAGLGADFASNQIQLKSQQAGLISPSASYDTRAYFSTFSPGVQLGYMHEFSNSFTLGIETNVLFDPDQTEILNYNSPINATVYDRFTFRYKTQTAIKARVGHAVDFENSTLLPYLTGGANFAKASLTYENEGGDTYTNSTTLGSWLVGAGVDWGFKYNWSLRAEYYYAHYVNTINVNMPSIYSLQDPNGNARLALSSSNILVSLNYWLPMSCL